ncbi:MAG: isocitrate dehydrogenase (NAD(+)) [Deltaproteobacteria bacterium]|nr:isocitrate dehydrogenase (NAD(+)) [Deltaproteobacteria bacterium]
MTTTLTLIPGDGIGPEVVGAAKLVLDAMKLDLAWEEAEAGAEIAARHGSNLPNKTLETVQRNKIALKGPTATAVGTGQGSANVALRKKLDLYANLRPVRNLPGVKTRYEGVDLVVVRENTEDLYAGLEHIVVPGVVESLKIITEKASLRIAQFAFDYARKNGRKKVTSVHKANIMKLSDGLFIECCKRVSRSFPEITYDEIIVDNCCMQLVKDPTRFDVLLLENLYGDIVSDLCAGLVGGLGVVPGANIGESAAVFEAVHGSAPDIAGKGIANPTAILLSGALMLRHMNRIPDAQRLEKAIDRVLGEGKVRTADLGGSASTTDYAKAVIAAL